MTTKPKAKKFRIRRSASLAGDPAPANVGTTKAPGSGGGAAAARTQAPDFDSDTAFANHDDGFGDQKFTPAQNANIAEPEEVASDAALDAIRREGLTGRQLRMARRVAQKHGLAPTSDFDAVRLLREQGIDPFERSTMLELVIADGKPAGGGGQLKPAGPNLPQTIQKPQLPSAKMMGEEARAQEIFNIQRDIARRRRRRLMLLLSRLAAFVLLPTLIAGFYYYNIATPLYATKSEFLIQKADATTPGSLGSLFSGTQFATTQDSITVQSYLQSREAMQRLDREHGFKAHFSQESIDPIKRLPPDATNEDAYKIYQSHVKIGFDPSEGIIKMEVIAADPQTSEEFSEALIGYAEEQVDQMSQRLREDQMKGAKESYEAAEAKMQAAQDRVLELQERLGVLDPVSETAALMGQITNFETLLRQKELELKQLQDNARPNQARVDGVQGDIDRLRALVAELRSQLTKNADGSASLARISGELKMAETDLATRQMMMQAALQQLETARIEANKQVRYITEGVSPVAPDEPTYPRKFENTLLSFLVFSGIYLMISLTASILKEQVTA
ncbi:capsule biosynthesis protein [Frigidibacter sp. ROC022]|uniref:capsule biosynthesis protein n=1 Tax=Frigidibacter sp. ROC022 TaxID=2971796 RepID=UPI00215ADF66|nr:capsule biosynthesis protein [Frigidibacter sp. ROC022]MCR8725892.1 capsule biosynthesis protein [Frigidibacter sp. ROC022]